MTEIEDKIEQYFLENIKVLRNLNKLIVNDISSSQYILSKKIYDFISLSMSNYSSFSILNKMLNEYIYNENISKTEKDYFVNKLNNHLIKLSKQPYLDTPDSVDRKSLIAFEEEYFYSIGGFLLGYLTEEIQEDKDFRSKCKVAIRDKSEEMIILFLKGNINKIPESYQKQAASTVKKYLRRRLSVKLSYPIINMHYFLMLTPKEDFQKQISRESSLEKLEADIIELCTRVLERNQDNKSEDEINDYFTDMLRSKKYNVTDQSRSGLSMSKKSSGEVDLMLRDERGLPITILEGLKLKNVSTEGKNDNLTKHISKLIDNYDGLGLSNKYLLVYCFTNDFDKFKRNYNFFLSSIKRNGNSVKINLDSVGQIRKPYGNDISNLAYISTFHRINGVYQKITHYLLNFKNKAEQNTRS